MKAQPKGAAPVSREVVEVVKRKMAPAGPPPAGLNAANFHAPKKYSAPPRIPSQYDEFDNPIEDELDSPPRGARGNTARFNHHTESDDYDESYDDYDDRRGRGAVGGHDRDHSSGRREGGLHGYSEAGEDDEDDDDECYYDDYHDRRSSFDDEDRYDDREYVNRPDSFYDDHGAARGQTNARRGSGGGRYEDEDGGYSNSTSHDKRPSRSSAGNSSVSQPKGDRDREREPRRQHGEPSAAKAGPTGGASVPASSAAPPDQRPAAHNPQPVANAKLAAHAEQIMRMGPVELTNSFLPLCKSNIFDYRPVLRATYRELKHFVLSPCPPGHTARCYIERNRSGSKMLAPFYSICADLEDGTGRELMVCRKILQSRSPHYIFSLKAEDLWRKREQRSRLYLGKLRATSSMEYVLYDNGICDTPDESEQLLREREEYDPSTADASSAGSSGGGERKDAKDAKGSSSGGDETSLYRRELVAIRFNTKSRPAPAGKRATEVCIPGTFSVDSSGQYSILGKPMDTAGSKAGAAPPAPGGSMLVGTHRTNHPVHGLTKPFDQVRKEKQQNAQYAKTCFVLHERTSRYDPLSSCLVDFKGRANMASVKNCQFVVSDAEAAADAAAGGASSVEALMKRDADKDYVLQLGKTTDDCFNVDFRYPMSLLQAFAICVARFDAKLTW